MSAAERVCLARAVVTAMTGNATFGAPAPTLTALATAADALRDAVTDAQVARARAREATSIQENLMETLTAMLVQEAAYVQNVSAGNHLKIESSGFAVRNAASPVGALPAPTGLSINVNTNPGVMEFKWEGVKGAMSYLLELAEDLPTLDWHTAATPTRPRTLVNSMTSGKRYWFRAAAIGAAGRGMWTSEVSKFAP